MTLGQAAYNEDIAREPTYHDGSKRKAWASLGDVERMTWEKNPTPRTYTRIELRVKEE